MELKANKQVVGYTSKLYRLDELFSERDPGAIQDPKFTIALGKSLDELGMEYPIIITTQEAFTRWISKNPHKSYFPKPLETDKILRVSIGNNRYFWAKSRGYTHIDCIYTDNWEDSKDITQLINMNYGEHF